MLISLESFEDEKVIDYSEDGKEIHEAYVL